MFEDFFKKFESSNSSLSLSGVDKEVVYKHFEDASKELEQGQKNNGVWTKAYLDAKGDKQATKARYIELMVERSIFAQEVELEILEATKEIEAEAYRDKIFSERKNQKDPFSWRAFFLFTIFTALGLILLILFLQLFVYLVQ